MKAAYITEPGPASSIIYGDLEKPSPKSGELLLRIHVAAINPIDTYVRSGAVKMPIPFPYIIGTDFAGIVESVGPEVFVLSPETESGEVIKADSVVRGWLPSMPPWAPSGFIQRTGRSPTTLPPPWRRGNHSSSGPLSRRPSSCRRNTFCQWGNRGCGECRRADRQGDRSTRHHHGEQRRKGKACQETSRDVVINYLKADVGEAVELLPRTAWTFGGKPFATPILKSRSRYSRKRDDWS